MEFLGQDYLAKKIQDKQQFLLRLLNINLFGYNPIRQWLGIDYKGKIDFISHLSYGYISDIKKDKVCITRVYQQPDLGYKLNLIIDSIPEILVPKYEQPSWGLLQIRLARCATNTYQPSSADTYLDYSAPNDNEGSLTGIDVDSNTPKNGLLYFNTSDLPSDIIITSATLSVLRIAIISLLETIGLTESISLASKWSKTLSETLILTDIKTLTGRWWNELTKNVSSWTHLTKHQSGSWWNKQY